MTTGSHNHVQTARRRGELVTPPMMISRMFVLLGGLLTPTTGCASDAPRVEAAASSPNTVAPSVESVPMLELTIRSADDVRTVTSALRQAALDGVPAATVHIDADRLDRITFQVGGTMTAPLMDLTIEGTGALHHSHVSLRGSRVTVRGLTFVGSPGTGDALQVTARDGVELTDLSFVGQSERTASRSRRRGARSGGRALSVWAHGPETTAQLTNLVVADGTVSPAVSFGGKPGGRFGEISLSHAVFAGTTAPVVHVSAAVGLSLDGVWSDAPEGAVTTVSPAIVVLGDVAPLSASTPALDRARGLHTAPEQSP